MGQVRSYRDRAGGPARLTGFLAQRLSPPFRGGWAARPAIVGRSPLARLSSPLPRGGEAFGISQRQRRARIAARYGLARLGTYGRTGRQADAEIGRASCRERVCQ